MRMETALILCDGYLGKSMGKTANGLVRYSKRFEIVGVIDSTKAGLDAGEVLNEGKCGIPVFSSFDESLQKLSELPLWLIIGVASIGGYLPKEFRPTIKKAIENRINIICGLHEFLSEDEEYSKLSRKYDVKIIDIRREQKIDKMHQFMNRCETIPAIRIPILGTDSAIGKRTTAIILSDAFNCAGIKTVFVATGQTGLLQGSKYGVPLDAIQGDYIVGELENAIVEAYTQEKPALIIIEGQGSISHPAYVCGTRAIINASRPSGIIIQHAPARKIRNYKKDVLHIPMPDLQKEIQMLELFSNSKVVAITINHENMRDDDITIAENEYEKKFNLPTVDVLKNGCGKLISHIKHIYNL